MVFLLLIIFLYLLKRTATIVCRENCHLVTLSKANYEKILSKLLI